MKKYRLMAASLITCIVFASQTQASTFTSFNVFELIKSELQSAGLITLRHGGKKPIRE